MQKEKSVSQNQTAISFWPKWALPFLAGISKALLAKTWINEYFGGFIPNP